MRNEGVIVVIEYHYNAVSSDNDEYYTELATEAPIRKLECIYMARTTITQL